jgi:hypothetical protein
MDSLLRDGEPVGHSEFLANEVFERGWGIENAFGHWPCQPHLQQRVAESMKKFNFAPW